MRLRLVIVQDEVFVFVLVDPRGRAQDFEAGQRAGLAGQLQACLVEMVGVKVAIAAGPDELADLQPALLREHVGEQRIAGDVERHAQEDIGGALIELQRQPAVGDTRLEQAMARRERHGVQLARIPRRDDLAARGGLRFDLLDQLGDLVDVAAVACIPVAPLLAVDGAKLARLVGPFVPDAYPLLLQPAHVGLPTQKPEQFDDDRAQVQLLGGEHGEALAQIEAHLRAEDGERAGAGPVHLLGTAGEHAVHEVEILAHPRWVAEAGASRHPGGTCSETDARDAARHGAA